MKIIPMNDMDKLLPPIEQAKMFGLIEEPEQIQYKEKQSYFLYGVAITCLVALGYFMMHHIIEQNKQRKEKKSFGYDFYRDKI